MRGLRTFREVQDRQTKTALGFNPLRPNGNVINALTLGDDVMMMAMAESADTLPVMQNASGTFFFVTDASLIDGPDELA
jgi:hypothetical protein